MSSTFHYELLINSALVKPTVKDSMLWPSGMLEYQYVEVGQ